MFHRSNLTRSTTGSSLSNISKNLPKIACLKTIADINLIARFLRSFTEPEVIYAVAVTTFWIIETVYQDSFGFCIEEGNKTPPELLGTCQRWGSAEFKQYCQSLQRIADRSLANAPADAVKSAEEAFIRVLELEIGFWEMSSSQS